MDLTSYVDTNEVVNFENWKATYTILHYVDTVGCVSCKLQLSRWNKFVEELDSISNSNAKCLLSFSPMNKKVLLKSLRINRFNHYVYIDEKDSLNKLNVFPDNEAFHTFLLDKDNKVLAIGNPVLNPKVKDLYLKIIQGKSVGEEEERERVETIVSVSSPTLSMGEFPYQEASSGTFTFTNTGKELWVIQDVVTSCGCLTVEYPKEPVRPGGQAVLKVTYRADNPGYFDKTLTVYSNAADSPLRLRVTGSAVE